MSAAAAPLATPVLPAAAVTPAPLVLTGRPALAAVPAAPARPAVVEAHGIIAAAGTEPVSLALAAGTVTPLSDAALADVLAMRRSPVAGTLRLDGVALDALGTPALDRLRRERVARLGATDLLLPSLTVRAHVRLAAAPARADALLAAAGLTDVAHRLPGALDATRRRLAGAAWALAAAPALLVAVDPAAGLDAAGRAALADLLAAGARMTGCAVAVTGLEAARPVTAPHGPRRTLRACPTPRR